MSFQISPQVAPYSTGAWTPVVTFATPGNLSVAYSFQVGTYTRIGNIVFLQCNLVTSTFTFTTASGALQITGLPFASRTLTANQAHGPLDWQGLTAASYTAFNLNIGSNVQLMNVIMSGQGVTSTQVTAANCTSATPITLRGSIAYEVA